MIKTKLRSILRLYILLIACVDTTGSTKVDASRIRKYLIAYFNELGERVGITVTDQEALISKYTDGRTMSRASGITLTDIVTASILLEDASVLVHGDSCQLEDQQAWDEWINTIEFDGQQSRTVHDFFKIRASAGKKYCNNFVYLRCQDDPISPTRHVCVCPSGLVWEEDKCVYQKGVWCWELARHSGLDKKFIVFRLNIDFGSGAYPRCVKNTLCNEEWKCQPVKHFEYYSSVMDIAVFARKHLDGFSKYPESEKIEIVKTIKESISIDRKNHARFVLSLELQMQNRLLEHGRPCDSTWNTEAEDLLKNYNGYDFEDDGRNFIFEDYRREEYMLKVIKRGPIAETCNHFKQLRCSSSICECREGLVFNRITGFCVVETSGACGWDQRMKLFKIMKVKPEDKEDPKSLILILTFYDNIWLECEQDSTCELVNPSARACVRGKAEELMEILELQLQLEQKFTIDLNGDCNVDAHLELFDAEYKFIPNYYGGFKNFKKAFKALIDQPYQFCRIRQYATCSLDGKCHCVPPAFQNEMVCEVEPEKCKSRSERHILLDKLVLPHSNLMVKSKKTFYCTTVGFKCVYDQYYLERLCSCKTGKNEWCEIGDRSEHVGHLNMLTLPKDMKEFGLKIIAELHTNLHQVEKAMKIEYGDPCDTESDKDFKFIFNFLSHIRKQCECKRSIRDGVSVWTCGTGICSTKPEFAKEKFDEILERTKRLVSKLRPSNLCNWNAGIRCVSGKCGCPAAYFYQDRHGKARCGVDLGDICSPLTNFLEYGEDDPLLESCRDGTQCTAYVDSDFRCEMPKLPSSKICPGGRCSVDDYISQVKNRMNQQLTEALASLKKVSKIQGKGEQCTEGEQELEFLNKTLVNIGPIQDFAKTSGNIHEERQKIRLISPTYEAILEMKVTYREHLYCKSGLTCSPKTRKCESESVLKPHPNPTPTSPPRSSACGLFPKPYWFEFNKVIALNLLAIKIYQNLAA